MATDFVATFKVILGDVSNEGTAHKVCEKVQDAIEALLDEEDEVSLTGLSEAPVFLELATQHQIMKLRAARNVLVALKFNDTYALAQQIDKFQWFLSRKMHPDDSDIPQLYDHGNFSKIAEEVWAGKNPMHR